MIKLLNFEFRKLFQQKSFYICFGIALLLTTLNVILMKSLATSNEEIVFSKMSMMVNAISSSNFIMIFGIFVALYVCDDFSNNTMKNIISRGYKREQIFFSKYLSSLVVSLFSAVIIIILTYVLCLSNDTGSESFKGILPIIFSQLIILTAYHSLYFVIAMTIRKVGGSVAFNLVGPTLIVTILTLTTSILKIDSLNINNYWLDFMFTSLVIGSTSDTIIRAIVMGIIYSILFIGIGVLLNKKKEI